MIPPKRYHAIIFHPGPKTHWRTARTFERSDPREVPVIIAKFEPDPSEVVIDKMFRFEVVAIAWARMYLGRLRNVLAEIHDTA